MIVRYFEWPDLLLALDLFFLTALYWRQYQNYEQNHIIHEPVCIYNAQSTILIIGEVAKPQKVVLEIWVIEIPSIEDESDCEHEAKI